MGKLSSILLGTVSGVAVALFLTSEKGKRVTSQAQDFIEDLREDQAKLPLIQFLKNLNL